MTLVIGLTGGIASGKSTVTAYLRQKGYQVIDADAVVHKLQKPGGKLYQALVDHFGPSILGPDYQLNRPLLGQKIFEDPREGEWSRQVQGDIIRQALWEEKDSLERTEPIFFMDIPLLLEAGYQDWFQEVWLVYVDKETQLKRLMERNHLSQEEAGVRIAAQMPIEEKRKLVDRLLDNGSSLEELYRQVDQALRELERR